jgi:membrane-associated phospholipid phosphatase
VDNFSIVVPVVAVYALNLAGVKGKHNFVDRTALYGMSYLIGTGVVGSIKRLSGVIRPDSSNRYSFPSGHTAQAFIAAEFMRQEYKDVSPWYGVAGYAVAATTGYLRMYNNKHWFNDVIAGAGIGIISTRLSYWLYPKIKNIFVRGKDNITVIMPTYQNGAVGFGLVHTFR